MRTSTRKTILLRAQLQRIVLPMLRVQSEEPFLTDCRKFFEHISTAPRIYKSLMSGRERAGARVVRETIEQHFEGALSIHSPSSDGIPRALLRRFAVSVLLGVAAHALNAEGTITPEEMQRFFQKLVGSDLTRAN